MNEAADDTAREPGPAEALAKHLRSVVERRLAQLEECRSFASSDDPVEAVHQLRVASRRLRAFTDVFAPLLDERARKRAKKPLRRVTVAVRTLRDWDVTSGLLGKRLDAADTDPERAAVEHLLLGVAKQRNEEEANARKRLEAVEEARLRSAIGEALAKVIAVVEPQGSAVTELTWDLVQPWVEVAVAGQPDPDREQPEQMHELRIALKRLRYAVELFEPAFGSAYGELHRPLTGVQELLGEHHDRVVLAALVDEAQAKLDPERHRVLAAGFARLAAHLAAERRDLYQRFRLEAFDLAAWRDAARDALGKGPA